MVIDCRKTTGKALLERRKLLIHLWKTNQIKHTYTASAKAVGISRQTAAKWLKEWQKRESKHWNLGSAGEKLVPGVD